MNNEKPKCKLIGEDGNAFAIIGKVRRTLIDNGQNEDAKEFSQKAFGAGSYDDVLRLVMEYVDVE